MERGARPQRNTILIGDARTRLAELPPASVDTVITSPPYYGLRDYGQNGQIGLETTVEGWVDELRQVMAGVARVLKPSGSLWLNIGDGYARQLREGAPKGSLLLGPERLALALQADGWIIRNRVIWAKTNPMPSSVRNRLSNTYELVFYLTRSADHYYYDLDAIRVPHRSQQQPKQATADGRVYPPPAAVAQVGKVRRTNLNSGLGRMKLTGSIGHPWGRNPGDTWTLPTAGFRQAHFAVMPLALVERPLLATCPERVCIRCGAPWRREGGPATTPAPEARQLRPACDCAAGWRPGLVLDPFMGAGTVAIAAEAHGRDWVGVELNPDYAAMAVARLQQARDKRAAAAEKDQAA